jgi:hypothetical protein
MLQTEDNLNFTFEVQNKIPNEIRLCKRLQKSLML